MEASQHHRNKTPCRVGEADHTLDTHEPKSRGLDKLQRRRRDLDQNTVPGGEEKGNRRMLFENDLMKLHNALRHCSI